MLVELCGVSLLYLLTGVAVLLLLVLLLLLLLVVVVLLLLGPLFRLVVSRRATVTVRSSGCVRRAWST